MRTKGKKVLLTLKVLILISLLAAVLVAGCVDNKTGQQTSPQQSGLTGEIKVDGATTHYPIMTKAAQNFIKANPGVKIDIKQSNTGGGYEKLINGDITIAMVTREPKDNEKDAAKNKGVDLYLTLVFYDAVTVITHPSNPMTDISFQQLRDIYFNGTITDWSQLTNGTKKGKINIYDTNPQKLGTAFVFNKKIAGDENARYVNGTTQFDILTLMSPAILNDTNSIGYNQIGGIPPEVKKLKVNGIAPSKQTILDATYPLSRKTYLVTNGPPTGAAKDFINYVLSRDGQKIVEDEGFIPLI